jgi:hypothetical protein
MVVAVNDAMKKMNFNSTATRKEVIALTKLMDHNQDYRVSLDEFMQFIDVFVRTRQWLCVMTSFIFAKASDDDGKRVR